MNQAAMADRFLSKQQLAEMLHVSIRTIDRWVDGGELPRPCRFGGKRLFDRRAIDQCIERKLQSGK